METNPDTLNIWILTLCSWYCIFYCKTVCKHRIEAVARRCSAIKVFLEIPQNSQENTCARVSFLTKLQEKATLAQVFSWEFCRISIYTFCYRTPPVAAFDRIYSHSLPESQYKQYLWFFSKFSNSRIFYSYWHSAKAFFSLRVFQKSEKHVIVP